MVHPKMTKITIDFETTSQVNLKEVGAWAYSLHPTTEVLCVGWDTGQWRMNEPAPQALFDIITSVDVVKAHNSFFEYAIWRNVCVRKYHWPTVPDSKWRCTAAKAAACAISRDLAKAGDMLNLTDKKDTEGKKAMQALTRGQKTNDEETWQTMLKYNRQDVIAENALDDALPDLSEHETLVWQASERMNARGFPIDRAGAKAALKIIAEYSARLKKEFQTLTGIESPTQRAKFIVWMNENGLNIDNTRAGNLDQILGHPDAFSVNPDVRRAIEILRSLGRSSTAKYVTMLQAVDNTDRVRGCFLYHGAGPGRWAGRLLQPHNFPRGNTKNIDQAWKIIHQGDPSAIELCEQDPMQFVSSALRGAICAPEGREFLVADYASIEARVTAWLANVKSLLKLFHENGDVYIAQAESIYNRKLTKKENPVERQLGKEAILGLGFGMGYVKFLMRIRSYNIRLTKEQICAAVPKERRIQLANQIRDNWDWVLGTMPDAELRRDLLDLVFTKFVVDKYRDMYPEIPNLWSSLETAAKAAVRAPGEVFRTHLTAWKATDRFLICKLPSGRNMRYFQPRLSKGGALHYLAAKGDTGVFHQETTYGGKLTENVVQATARDIMADAMLRLEDTPPYHEIVMTVHDELVSEIDADKGDVKEFEKLVSAVPGWAQGMPVGAEAWRGRRYRK